MQKSKAGVIDTSQSPYAKLKSVPVSAVTLMDGFWKPKMEANRNAGIPALLDQLEEHGVVDNFRRVSGRKNVERKGPFFTDSDLFKWMEAAAFVLQTQDDPRIRERFDSVIDDVIAAQCDDGYLNTFFTGDLAGQRFRNLPVEHELYCAGHFFQAAIAHHRATGEKRLLDAALRYADFLVNTFGPGKIEQADGHPEIEMAMVEMYRATGNCEYLKLAGFYLYVQKFAEKKEIEGHAVRAGYLAAGAADYYIETGDQATLAALEAQWQDMMAGKIYITGGIGSRHGSEALGDRYELPNAHAYAETCAAISNIFWNFRMLGIGGEARFADVMETTLYNGFLSGVSLKGDKYFYVNPLASDGRHERQAWYDCTCCPPNVQRMLASLPGYFFSTSEEGLWVHLYDNCKLDWRLEDGSDVGLEMKTRYPWDGKVEIKVMPQEKDQQFTLFLRIPGWCESALIIVEGEEPKLAEPGTYFKIKRRWNSGDTVKLDFPMEVMAMEADPRVREDLGSVAIQRGPIIYCLESPDNPRVSVKDAEIAVGEELFESRWQKDLLGGVVVVEAQGLSPKFPNQRGPLYRPLGSFEEEMKEVDLALIPYYAWCNRGKSQMAVWIPYIEADEDE